MHKSYFALCLALSVFFPLGAHGQQIAVPPVGPVVPGTIHNVTVRLLGGEPRAAGLQVDLAYYPEVSVKSKSNGKPDCAVEPGLQKQDSSFSFVPVGCSGSSCAAVRAVISSTSNTMTIPSGYALFSCKATISSSASHGIYPMVLRNMTVFDHLGGALNNFGTRDGYVVVDSGVGC